VADQAAPPAGDEEPDIFADPTGRRWRYTEIISAVRGLRPLVADSGTFAAAAADFEEWVRLDGIVESRLQDFQQVWRLPDPMPATVHDVATMHRAMDATVRIEAGRARALHIMTFGQSNGFFADLPDNALIPEAEERGLSLLRSWLTPDQLAQYDRENAFEVTGSATGKRYRIEHGRQQNVIELDAEGRDVRGLCFTPIGNLVPGDCMLAQKIALEADEPAALKVARPFPPWGSARALGALGGFMAISREQIEDLYPDPVSLRRRALREYIDSAPDNLFMRGDVAYNGVIIREEPWTAPMRPGYVAPLARSEGATQLLDRQRQRNEARLRMLERFRGDAG
jgi:hypothetical protein